MCYNYIQMYIDTPACIVSRCPNYASYKGRCEQHQLPQFQTNRKERLPADWNHRRNAVLKRDNGICYLCGKPGADSVDHIEAGDNHDYDNLAAAHQNVPPYCHRTKTANDGNKAREAMKPAKPGSYWQNEYNRRQQQQGNNSNGNNE